MNQDVQVKHSFSKHSSDVKLEHVSKIFIQPDTGKKFVAVDDINLHIKTGEMVTLLGPSGCGKTTTLRMISGFEFPTAGHIYIGNQAMENVAPNRRNLAMVFQSYALFPHMNIFDNVSYGLKVKRLPKDEILERTKTVMELMQLTGLEKRKPNQLSGGQQQRVALARAVVIEPGVLLFDEPLSNLDAKLRESMRDELRQLQQTLGITSLYVTHDQSEAMAISDRIMIMKDGKLIQTGSPKQIYEYPINSFIANFIGKSNQLPVYFRKRNENGQVEVDIAGITLTLPNAGDSCFTSEHSIKENDKAYLSVRPESMYLSDVGDGIDCTVVRRVYFGSEIQYEIKIKESEEKLTIDVYNPQMTKQFQVGDHLKLQFDLACVRLLPN